MKVWEMMNFDDGEGGKLSSSDTAATKLLEDEDIFRLLCQKALLANKGYVCLQRSHLRGGNELKRCDEIRDQK